MAITTSYELKTLFEEKRVVGNGSHNADIATLANGGFVFGGTDGDSTYSTSFDANGKAIAGGNNVQSGYHASFAGLAGGAYVMTTEDADSVTYQLFSSEGGALSSVFDTDLQYSSNADVTSLGGGGFAIASQLSYSTTDNDIRITRYTSTGTLLNTFDVSKSLDNDHDAAITTLDNGNMAVTWVRTEAGVDQLWLAVYTPDGKVIAAPTWFDGPEMAGTRPQIAAVAGGFVIGYPDQEWNTGTADITLAKFSSTGVLASYTNVSNPTLGDDASFDANVSLARMSNGMLAVSWDNNYYANDTDTRVALVDPATMTTLAMTQFNSAVDQEDSMVAGYGQGMIAMSSYSAADQFGVSGVGIATIAAVRVLTGDANNNKITAIGDMSHHLIGLDGNDTLIGNIVGDTLDGGAGDDKLFGQGGDDIINGGDGNDQIEGGAGADTMAGGAGNDVYTVDNSKDTVFEGASQGIDTVTSSISFSLGSNVENLTLLGNGPLTGKGNGSANTITGNNGSNMLYGNGGIDVLDGGAGADTLSGGAKADTLTGGSGADRFLFDVLGTSADKDTVTDFTHGTDKLAFTKAAFTAFAGYTSGHVLDAEDFALGASATTADQHVIYNKATGALYYDSDGVGGAAQIHIATLMDHASLTASDILIL